MNPTTALACALTAAFAVGTATATALWLRRQWFVVTVTGQSMHPALHDGDRVLARRTRPHLLRRGQIVLTRLPPPPPGAVFPTPEDPHNTTPTWNHDALMVKRVTALPGDPVPHTVRDATGTSPGDTVPAGHLVLIGDNPRSSRDSRTLGFLPAHHVVATVRRTATRSEAPLTPPAQTPTLDKPERHDATP